MPIPYVHVSSLKKECINPSHRAGDEGVRGLTEEGASPALVMCLKGGPGPLNGDFSKWNRLILTTAPRGTESDFF